MINIPSSLVTKVIVCSQNDRIFFLKVWDVNSFIWVNAVFARVVPHICEYTHQKKFSNTWWWNCGYSNHSKRWNAGCAQSTRCTNLAFTPFDTSHVIVFLIKLWWGNIHGNVFSDTVFLKDTLIGIKDKFPQHWFALKTFHRCIKWDIFVSNDNSRNKFKEKCRVMSFTDPCDVSDDVIPGHVKIGICDMLSVFPCIRLFF